MTVFLFSKHMNILSNNKMKYHYKMCYVILLPPFLDLFLFHCENKHKKSRVYREKQIQDTLTLGKKTQLYHLNSKRFFQKQIKI